MAEIRVTVRLPEGRCAVHTGLQALHDLAEGLDPEGIDSAGAAAGAWLFGIFLEELEKQTDAAGENAQLNPDCPDCAAGAGPVEG